MFEKRENGAGMYQRCKNINLNEIQRSNERVSQDKDCLERHNDSISLPASSPLWRPLAFASPFAYCSSVTFRDSPKWRACSQAIAVLETSTLSNAVVERK